MEKSLTGNEAVAYAIKQINPDVMAAYPITPSTAIPEKISEYVNSGEIDTEFINVESEHSAMAACIGASLSGARTFTATSSNGLAYMFEMLHIASSMRTSVVLSLVTRAISGPLNIHNDHSDAMAIRDTGFVMIFSEDNKEVYDNTLIATRLAEDERVKLPVAVIQDGYITSHSRKNITVLDDSIVKNFVGEFNPNHNLLDKDNPITVGTLDLPEFLFEHKMGQANGIKNAKMVLKELDKEFEKISGEKYGFFEEYKTEDAKNIIIVLGSAAGTIKDEIDKLREEGEKVGLIKIRLYRPFPGEEIIEYLKTLENLENIAILDKVMPMNSNTGPLCLDISSALYNSNLKYNLLNYIYGIGGRDFKKEYVKKIYDDLNNFNKNEDSNIVRYLGLREE